MKMTIPVLFTGAILIASLALTGCASSGGSKAGASTSTGMTKAGEGVEALAAQTDVTMAALNDLVLNPGDLPAQFKTYDKAVKKLSSEFQKAVDQTENMRKKADSYFQQWQADSASIANEEIRKLNTDRLEEVKKAFTEVDESLKQVKADYSPFLSDLNDIRQALSLDLTSGGVKALSGIAEKAMPKGKKLKDSLMQAAADAKHLGTKLASAVPQAESK
jgi:predicted  nucleic acid-binding Zn-ribbon protein